MKREHFHDDGARVETIRRNGAPGQVGRAAAPVSGLGQTVRLSSEPRGAFGFGGEPVAPRPPDEDVEDSGDPVRASAVVGSTDVAGTIERIVWIAAGENAGDETDDTMPAIMPAES